MFYELLNKLRAQCEQELKKAQSEYAKFLYERDINEIANFLNNHEQKEKDKAMKKAFNFTIEQAKALKSLVENELINIELAKNEKFIEKAFYTDIQKYLAQRITDLEK